MEFIIYFLFFVLIILSLLGKKWAYIATIILGILFFPARVGFHFDIKPCEFSFNLPLAIYSLTNYKHIVLFAVFFIMTRRNIRTNGWKGFGWAALATLLFGIIVELGEGVTGDGHCRIRDLVPDVAGVLLGQLIFFFWNSINMKLISKHKNP
jgi:hypothetical protein